MRALAFIAACILASLEVSCATEAVVPSLEFDVATKMLKTSAVVCTGSPLGKTTFSLPSSPTDEDYSTLEQECAAFMKEKFKGKSFWVNYNTGLCKVFTLCESTKSAITNSATFVYNVAPTRGWSSWNAFYKNATYDRIMGQVKQMVNLGFLDAGYDVIHADGLCTFQNTTDGTNVWRSHLTSGGAYTAKSTLPEYTECFPAGIKSYVDEVHAKGFRVSWYTAGGVKTCSDSLSTVRSSGSTKFKAQVKNDLATYASWGIDILKLDQCDSSSTLPMSPAKDVITYWATMRNSIYPNLMIENCRYACNNIQSGADRLTTPDDTSTFASYCPYIADYHRTWVDIRPWAARIFGQAEAFAPLNDEASPSFGWTYGDALEVCNYDFDNNEFKPQASETAPTPMTKNLEYAHVGLWVIASQPLFLSTDLSQCDNDIISVLQNSTILGINEMWSGDSGARVLDDSDYESTGQHVWIWRKSIDFSDGTTHKYFLAVDVSETEYDEEFDTASIASERCPTGAQVKPIWSRSGLYRSAFFVCIS